MKADPDDVLWWMFVVGVALLVMFAAVALTMTGLRSYSEARERDACGHDGGRVDYYDAEHTELWRCVKPVERAP